MRSRIVRYKAQWENKGKKQLIGSHLAFTRSIDVIIHFDLNPTTTNIETCSARPIRVLPSKPHSRPEGTGVCK